MSFLGRVMDVVPQLRVGLVLAGFGVLAAALAGQTYRLDRAQTALTVERAGHAATAAQLATATASLSAIASQATALDQAAERAQARLEAAAKSFESKVKRIRTAPAPASCEAAIDLLRKDAQGGL